MNEIDKTSAANAAEQGRSGLARQVGAKAARKHQARRSPTPGVWFGLGMMGMIGWSVVAPTLLGAALGIWIDQHYPGPRAWTLALLVAGLAIGCCTAWYWVAQEHQAMQATPDAQDADHAEAVANAENRKGNADD
jgi:ATP synthase protein I